jgi:glycosyltransferase involved in cell wall biosynthesis
LIELTASLVARGEDLHLVLFGDGRARDDLESLARERGIEGRLTFTGADPGARRWIKAFDVFCFTSTDEGLPNVVMEAAAAGVPVLAWRTDFIRELLTHGGSAVLADLGDIRALGEGLSELIRNREYRLRIGEEARKEVIANFGVRAYVRKLSEVYETLLDTNGESRA